MKVNKCKIINNRPICGLCNSSNLSMIRDSKVIEYNQEMVFMCSTNAS